MKPNKLLFVMAAVWLLLARHDKAHAGAIWRAFFDNNLAGITGTTIDDLLAASDFERFGGPFFPQLLEEHFSTIALDGFNSDDGIDNFGSLIHGYIQAPMDGDYVIVVASDDNSELYLGQDHTVFPFRDSARLIGSESGWTNGDIWTAARFDERSSTVNLQKGKIYFIEVLHKEGTGGAFVNVAWQRPDGVRETIPGHAMLPYGTSSDHMVAATSTEITVHPQDVQVVEKNPALFYATVFGPQPMTFQWLVNGAEIPGANLVWLELDPEIADSGKNYSLRITNGSGQTTTTSAATLTVEPDTQAPTVVSATGSGADGGIVVVFSEGVDTATASNASNYTLTEQTVTVNSVSMKDARTVVLHTTEYASEALTLGIRNVKDRSSRGNTIAANTSIPVSLSSGLLIYTAFEDAPGSTTVVDAAGRYNGKLEGATLVNDPVRGGVVSFDGDDDYVDFGNEIPELLGTDAFSVSLWFNRTINRDSTDDDTNHGINNVLVAHSSNADNDDYELGTLGAGVDVYLDTTGKDGGMPVSPAGIVNGQWHHVVTSYDRYAPVEFNIYVDGVLVRADDTFGGATDGAGDNSPWTLGMARPDGDRWGDFTGFMDDVAFYTIGLSPAMAAALADGSATPLNVTSKVVGPIEITQQPSSNRTQELVEVSFRVESTGTDPNSIRYQWYRGGTPMPGAVNQTLTLSAPTVAADNGAQFHVEIFNANGAYNRAVSETITLTVNDDPNPPVISKARGVSGGINRVIIQFNEPVDPATAENTANYKINGLSVMSATLDVDEVTVTLETSTQTEGASYTLTVQGVADIVGNVGNEERDFISRVTYPDAVMADNPDIYITFGQVSDGFLLSEVGVDVPGSPIAGRLKGTTLPVVTERLVVGSPDGAILFDSAQSQSIFLPDSPNTNDSPSNPGTGNRTYELWFQARNLPVHSDDVAQDRRNRQILYEEGGSTRGLSIYLDGVQAENPTEADLYLQMWNAAETAWGGQSGPVVDDSGAISTRIQGGQTYHVVFVQQDGDNNLMGTLTGYLNGQQFGQVGGIGFLFDHTDDTGFGFPEAQTAYFDGLTATQEASYFDGIIDEFAVYDGKALTAAQILNHYNLGLVEVEADPISGGGGPGSFTGISLSGNQVTIEWDSGILQSSGSVNGPFEDVAGASSPYTADASSGGNVFYRLR